MTITFMNRRTKVKVHCGSLQAPARVFRHGKLKIHKTYNGPVPLTYVDTGVYKGGMNDYYEAYTEQDLCWARRLNYVLKYHQIPRWEACNHKTKM